MCGLLLIGPRVYQLCSHALVLYSGNGNIDFDEFVTMMMSKPRPISEEEVISEAFHRFDLNGDGVLSREELRQAMISMGEGMSEEEIDEMIREADENRDGVIDYRGRRNLLNISNWRIGGYTSAGYRA